MVIKETKNFESHYWRDPKNWRDRLPQEIRIHQLVEERRAVYPEICQHLIRMRSYRLLMVQRKYRLYLDFCGGGDLFHAMLGHEANWASEEDRNTDSFLPQGYIWYIIKALASACLVLRTGTTDEESVQGWKAITHMDWQLTNVLLDFDQRGNVTMTEKEGSKGKGKQPAEVKVTDANLTVS
jgi:hypothetical protein